MATVSSSSPSKVYATDVTLSKKLEEEMRALFMSGDIDKNGLMSEAEFRYVMRRNGSKMTDDDVKNTFQGADLDGDGRLSYDEFVKLMIKMTATVKNFTTDFTLSKEEEKEMRSKFMASDVDNDGFITVQELLFAATTNGAKLTDDDVKNADLDGDGRFSYDEFVKYMMAMKIIEEAAMVTNVKLSNEDEKTMRKYFTAFDVDKDGFIPTAEFQDKWKKETDEGAYKNACRLIKKYDVDGDGRLNYDEFVKVMITMKARAAMVEHATVSEKVNKFIKFVVKTLF